MDQHTQEALLEAWLSNVLHIRANRLMEGLSFNEIVICGMLYRHQRDDPQPLTATDLGQRTKLLKSQLNKVLNQMEDRGLIQRVRSSQDKRRVEILLRDEMLPVYFAEHEKVMQIIDAVCDALGEEKVRTLTRLLQEAVQAAEAKISEETT